LHFFQTCYEITFQDHILSGVRVVPISEVHMAAMLVLLMTRNKKNTDVVPSSGMIFMPSFTKICQLSKLLGWQHHHHMKWSCHVTSLPLLKKREGELNINQLLKTKPMISMCLWNSYLENITVTCSSVVQVRYCGSYPTACNSALDRSPLALPMVTWSMHHIAFP
jgi:hypothetical protein